jgi:translocation and assembly module TamB
LSLDPAHPLLQLDFTGKDLRWGRWGLDSITASSPDAGPGTRIDIAGLALGERAFESVSVMLSGESPLDVIELEAHRGETQVQARLSGTVLDWDHLPHATWSGRLETLNLGRESVGSLALEQAANLILGTATAVIEPACLRGSQNGLTCFDFNWNEAGSLEANATLDSVVLNVVNLALPTTLDFSQRMSGEIHWSEAPGRQTTAEVNIRLSPGLVTAADGAADLSTGPGVFGFRIENGQLLAGNLDIALPGVGAIDTDFTLPQVSLMEDSPIEGRAQVMLENIEAFSDWIPGIDGLEGAINADMRIGGTAVEPALTGYASLVRGRVEIEPLGVTVGNIQLAGAVFEHDYTTLTGSFTSGKGTGRINASVKFAEFLKPEIALELTGQNLTVANVPDMTVRVNPDLRMKWLEGALDVNGSVLIPYARISPRYLPTTNASESDDLVIVAGQKKFSDENLLRSSRLRINGSVSVELGEQVGVSFQRAKAKLQGKTTFTWKDNLVPVGDGMYTVSGKISAYGQALEVDEGRVSFPLVPANNPHLNIKAEREIYGNVQIKKAGVLITGTLKRPVLENYTSPVTTEERALALLITGHDFDYDQGVGAVEVGLYIAPKLYVSYGIGLFEPQSVISVRYDLKRGWGIKATSGQRETGADISYTIDH